jgi:sigma-E factor negative regulatory protein RseB
MFRVVCALALSLICFNGIAADDPWFLLQKTAYAARELNYQGIFVYQNGNQTRSVQITHMNNDGQEMARNVVMGDDAQAGQAREVYSQGSDILIVHPKNQKMVIEKRRGKNLFPAMFSTNIQAIKASYTARTGVIDMVAGRSAQIVELVPNDAYRYSYKIWADTEFGILLKMAVLDSKNQKLEQIAFNQLSMLNSQDVNWFQPKIDVKKNYVMEDVNTVSQVNNNWVLATLPPGYSKVDHIAITVPGKVSAVDQVIISDGIASVSLFIEPLSKNVRPKMGHMLVGSTNICAHSLDGYQITVVGEVPAATVMQIAKAVSFKKQTALK